MERPPCESESIYDFDYLLAKRKETVKRGQTYDVDDEGEPIRPLCRPKITQDSIRLPPLPPLVVNTNSSKPPPPPPAARNPTSRRTQEAQSASMLATTTTRPKKDPDRLKGGGFLPDIGAKYSSNSTSQQHGGVGGVKATPSEILVSYKTAEAEKKREWDLKYERMMRERREMRELDKGNQRESTREADRPYPDAPTPATYSMRDIHDYDDHHSKLRTAVQVYGYDSHIDVSVPERYNPTTGKAGTKGSSFQENNVQEASGAQKADWDRRYNEHLMKRDRHAQVTQYGSSTSLTQAANLTGKTTVSSCSWKPQSSLPAPSVHGHASRHPSSIPPHAQGSTTRQKSAHQSHTKRRRGNNSREAGADRATNNLSRYRSPTDFMEDFDRTMCKTDEMERRFDDIRAAARKQKSGTKKKAINEDPDADFLRNLDDILANIDIACGRSS